MRSHENWDLLTCLCNTLHKVVEAGITLDWDSIGDEGRVDEGRGEVDNVLPTFDLGAERAGIVSLG
jgi:hypothetical protein